MARKESRLLTDITKTTELKRYSLYRGLYARVARRLGVDRSYVSRVARGERRSPQIEKPCAPNSAASPKPERLLSPFAIRVSPFGTAKREQRLADCRADQGCALSGIAQPRPTSGQAAPALLL